MNKFFVILAIVFAGGSGYYGYHYYKTHRPVDMAAIERYTAVREKFESESDDAAHKERMMVYDMLGYTNPRQDFYPDCTRYQALRIAEWYKNNPDENLVTVANEWLKNNPGKTIDQMPGLQMSIDSN